ncbi:hypothetical protein ACH4S9_17450 [Streptomyces sp. NPDC021225]|uniref:hypothetical protein n=1 Tax=Streptomyces sp. NPDC021225 TaxID=3365121 RepID=UPI003791B1E2
MARGPGRRRRDARRDLLASVLAVREAVRAVEGVLDQVLGRACPLDALFQLGDVAA